MYNGAMDQRFCLQLVAGFAAVAFSSAVSAQEGEVIDLFENQGELQAKPITVESLDGRTSSAARVEFDEGDSSGRYDGGLTLRYERNGSAIIVPAKIEGREVYFLFDTGASFTTLSSAFAKKVGILPKKGYPATMVQTANGPTLARFGLINSIQLAGRSHSGVTYTICDACPSGTHKGKPLVGLLGMNVIGRYRTSFDDARGVIEMIPTHTYSDRARDIEPWIQVSYDGGKRKGKEGKQLVFVGRVRNNAPRRIDRMTVAFTCAGGETVKVSKAIASGSTAQFKATMSSGDCRKDLDADIVDSRW